MVGSLPLFSSRPGADLVSSQNLPDYRGKRLLFGQLDSPGSIHVFSTECRAGERLRMQMLVPVLPLGGSVAPAFAIIAQSLPYSADVHRLPLELPSGYSAVVAPPASELLYPVRDALTRVRYYSGPSIDTKTLIGGRCYVVVWSPQNRMGKYILQVGYRWPLHWKTWVQIPRFWWQIRGWYGMSRAAAYVGLTAAAVVGLALWRILRGRHRKTV